MVFGVSTAFAAINGAIIIEALLCAGSVPCAYYPHFIYGRIRLGEVVFSSFHLFLSKGSPIPLYHSKTFFPIMVTLSGPLV